MRLTLCYGDSTRLLNLQERERERKRTAADLRDAPKMCSFSCHGLKLQPQVPSADLAAVKNERSFGVQGRMPSMLQHHAL